MSLKRLTYWISLLSLLIFSGQSAAAQATAELEPHRAGGDGIAVISNRTAADRTDRVWQLTGPFGGDVMALAVDPRNADRILIGTSDGQIYHSVDGGRIWRLMRPGIKAAGFTVTVILFDREKPGRIYIGVKAVTDLGERTKGGSLYFSDNDGESWRELEGLHGKAIRGLAQSSKDPNVLVAAALDGIYRTRNRGEAWERITPAYDPELRGFHSVAIDPRDSEIIYVGTHHLPWKTLDGGVTWKRAGTQETGMIDDSDIFAIHIDDSNPDTVLMSACSGIYRSLDASAKWTKIQGIPYDSRRTHIIYQHPTKPEIIFAGTTEGLWVSHNFGKADSWRRMTSETLVINSVAVHPSRPERIFLGTEDSGVLISQDGGETYEISNAGFINRQVRAVMADQAERGRVYAGVIFDGVSSGLFVSQDGGLNWRQATIGEGIRDVYSLYQPSFQTQTVYAGTNLGLFRSDDRGDTWAPVKKLPAPPDPKTIAPTPKTATPRPRRIAPTRELIVRKRAKPQARNSRSAVKPPRKQSKKVEPPAPPVNDLMEIQNQVFSIASLTPRRDLPAEPPAELKPWMIASTWDGLFVTEDESKGWKRLTLREGTTRDPHPNAVATSPHAPGLILVGTEDGLFVSTDNGRTFRLQVLPEEARRVRSLVFDPRTPQTIYAGTASGFFRSLDGGITWEQRGGGMPIHTDVSAILINELNPDEIYLADDLRGAIYHSLDRGSNWEKLDISDLPSTRIRSAASDPFDRQRLYLGTFSGGIYVMSR